MAIVITGDLSWTGALVLFLEELDGGPAADTDGYAFTSSGDMEYSCTVTDAILGLYRCVAKTSGGIIAGAGYVTVGASTTAVRIRSEEAAVLDSDAQAMVTAFNAMRSGNVYTAPALANAPSGGDATLAKQNQILDRLSSVTVGVTGYAQLDIYGVLQLKRGHTAILTFTSSTSNIVSDLSASTTKVFFGIKDAAGRSWLSLEGTKLVNTGLQSVRFSISAALATAMINGEHFFDVVAVYGYDASTTPKYTSLEPFTSGRAKVTDLYVDI